MSDSTLEDEIPDFSNINPYSFQPIQIVSRSPSLSSSSNASMEERNAGTQLTNWKKILVSVWKMLALETEKESLFSGHKCITEMEEFQLLFSPEVILKNMLSALNDLRGHSPKTSIWW